MSCRKICGPNQLIIVNALLSIIISDDLSADGLNFIGNFLMGTGQLMLQKAAQLTIQQTEQDTKAQIQLLEEQIQQLKQKL